MPPRLRAVRPWRPIAILAILTVAMMGSWIILSRIHSAARQQSALEQFWAPAFATPQPVLICLAKPIVYRPNLAMYQRYSRAHPGNFESEVERSNRALPLDDDQELVWSDLVQYPDYGVAVGDVDAAVKVSALLGKIGSQARLGLAGTTPMRFAQFSRCDRWRVQQQVDHANRAEPAFCFY